MQCNINTYFYTIGYPLLGGDSDDQLIILIKDPTFFLDAVMRECTKK